MSDGQKNELRPYYHSKWKCPVHGFYFTRTEKPPRADRPAPCPECKPELLDHLKGKTTQEVPFTSKPRWPKKTDIQPIASEKRPLRKRGAF